jgi:hypothetical protein
MDGTEERELFLNAYKDFLDTPQKDRLDLCDMEPYEKHKMDRSIGSTYDDMESEFTRELLNSINQFAHKINSLIIWNEVISKYETREQFELRREFTRLPIYYCLNQPRAIKDRLMFCSTHLCNQANLKIDNNSKDDLPGDPSIREKHFHKKVKNWKSYEKLLSSLNNLTSHEYDKVKTKDYRNMAHHRIPLGIEYGITNFVTRLGYQERTFEYITIEDGKEVRKKQTTKGVSYRFGGTPPLILKDLLPVFKEQQGLATEAFKNYWCLVNEHQNTICSD